METGRNLRYQHRSPHRADWGLGCSDFGRATFHRKTAALLPRCDGHREGVLSVAGRDIVTAVAQRREELSQYVRRHERTVNAGDAVELRRQVTAGSVVAAALVRASSRRHQGAAPPVRA